MDEHIVYRGECVKVSVAMAAYNGELYIREQLESILVQLDTDDEVVVSDDNPGSEMSKLVWEMAKADSRIRYIEGPSKGVIKNFENAIRQTHGDIIFLADQDDIWLPGKVEAVKREFEKGAILVMHDAKVVDAELNVIEESFFKSHKSRKGYLKNVWRNSYMGCCMAFDKSLKERILPFPEDIPMHDQYIGLQAENMRFENMGKVVLLDTPYLLYRKHGNNVTGGETSFSQKLQWRRDILKSTMTPARVIDYIGEIVTDIMIWT